METDLRIAAVIFHSPVGFVRENLERTFRWVTEAQKREVDVVCFPELNITGYQPDPEATATAEKIPGSISQELARMAAVSRILILAGMLETDGEGHVYASHLAAGPEGILGVYRKTHIAPPEWGIFEPGNETPLFEYRGVTFGIQLCYDSHFPEISTRMALDGADLIFIPHASPRGSADEKLISWSRHLTARAFDNGLYVVACNQCGENGRNLRFPGVALVIGPNGDIMARQSSDRDTMLVFDLKAELLGDIRRHPMRYFLPNRREDLFPTR